MRKLTTKLTDDFLQSQHIAYGHNPVIRKHQSSIYRSIPKRNLEHLAAKREQGKMKVLKNG